MAIGHFRAHLDDKAAHIHELLGSQCERRVHLRPHRAVGVEPDVVDAARNQFAQPGFGAKFGDIRLADTRGDAGEDALLQTGVETAHRAVKNVLLSPAFIAHHLPALDADEGRGIADLAQSLRHFVRDELPIGEDLKIGVGMPGEQVEQIRVHEGLAAKDSEEGVSVRLRVANRAIERFEIDLHAVGLHIHPATLAAEIA